MKRFLVPAWVLMPVPMDRERRATAAPGEQATGGMAAAGSARAQAAARDADGGTWAARKVGDASIRKEAEGWNGARAMAATAAGGNAFKVTRNMMR